MTITDFLTYLVGGGALVAASWILGQIPGYDALSDKIKQWIFFAVAIFFGGGAFAITKYVPVATINAIAPYFGIAAFAFLSIFINRTYTKLVTVLKLLKDKQSLGK